MTIPAGGKVVTLAIRIDSARHAQLAWIAELRGSNLKQECFKAVDAYIEAAKADPELMARADAARAAIEEEARARQTAIANLFTAAPPAPAQDEEEAADDEPESTTRSRTRRTGKQTGEQPDS